MKKRTLINIILIVSALAIAFIIGRDFVVNRQGKQLENPYELDLKQFAQVNPEEILYAETKAIQLNINEAYALSIFSDTMYVVADSTLLLVNQEGQILKSFQLSVPATAIAVNQSIWLALKNRIINLNKDGDVLKEWADLGPRSVLTSLAVDDQSVFAADAGNRVVYQFSKLGELKQKLGERDEQKGLEGFTVPSPYFDVALSEDGFLWAVNPGTHSLINFNVDGSLRTYWSKSSANTAGFSGCCNPAHMCIATQDKFITSEKGIVRVKVYDQHGEYQGVVAAPDQFDEYSLAPDVCVDNQGRIVLLDFNRKQIRFFEAKNKEL
ncbi:NHL repeat-containing protein [Mangrovibacterium lignilyticum]|uniref:hypothetical protein n=1 Tax=Mangrovibacterium lignilyticum TaxID=2668052 RepID=UPI0013D3DF04|nr:hypothetical protein [Mangrovibacterium lignilyticum]